MTSYREEISVLTPVLFKMVKSQDFELSQSAGRSELRATEEIHCQIESRPRGASISAMALRRP